MAASQQGSDRIISTDSTKLLNISTLDAKEEPASSDNLEEQDATTIGPPRDVTSQSGSLSAVGDYGVVYPPNVYSPQAQTFYYGGYENATGEWGEYRQYVAAENLEIGSPGIYNDNPALVFHPGYGHNPHMPYGPYSPVTTPLSSVRGDGQIYSPQQFPFSGPPYYQQSVPSSMQYITSTPLTQTELTMSVSSNQQGDGMLFGPRPGYPSHFGSFGKGDSFPGNSGNPSFYDSRQGFDGFGSSGPWSDWSKSSDGHRSLTPLSSPAVSPQPINMLGSFGHNVGMVPQQKRPSYGFGSGSSSYTRGYPHSAIYPSSSFGSGSLSSLGTNDRWLNVDKARRRGRDIGSLCSCNGTLDILSEQNRGPRASKPKNQTTTEHISSVDNSKNGTSTTEARSEPYNLPDFVTEYKDAKFFIIKSYSEDNVHKSIKYGVWASTPNGNRKLDAAYCEAKEKDGTCPVFLLFSVNASAQFCGVAEMVGPVDFEKSVDYWQQDKWSGQFPVKWHIIKDVPNSQFRHIVLENNDNKPVTNSRDTQEVKLEQGLEMLTIFKKYETDLSILDDFDFYEERQKAMQERKGRQQANSMTAPMVGDIEQRNTVTLSSDFIKQMSKSFAQAVRMEDSCKENTTEKGGTGAASSVGNGVKPEDSKITSVVSSVQSS